MNIVDVKQPDEFGKELAQLVAKYTGITAPIIRIQCNASFDDFPVIQVDCRMADFSLNKHVSEQINQQKGNPNENPVA